MRPATTNFVLRKFGSYRSLPSLDNCPVVYTGVGRNVKGILCDQVRALKSVGSPPKDPN